MSCAAFVICSRNWSRSDELRAKDLIRELSGVMVGMTSARCASSGDSVHCIGKSCDTPVPAATRKSPWPRTEPEAQHAQTKRTSDGLKPMTQHSGKPGDSG